MSTHFTRRDFLTSASALGAASMFGLPRIASAEPPPNELIARGTDWRFLNELKKELKA